MGRPRWVSPVAYGVTLLALTYALLKLGASWQEVATRVMSPGLRYYIGVGALVYGAAGFLLSSAWGLLLRVVGEPDVTLSMAHAMYGRTQIAKYIPGNVFHLAGRHAIGRTQGLGNSSLASAALLEALLLIACTTSISLLWGGDLFLERVRPAAVIGALALLAAAVLILARGLRNRSVDLPATASAVNTRLRAILRLIAAWILYGAFFVVVAGLLWGLLRLTGADSARTSPRYDSCLAAISLAWLAGFLVPGATAGLGVREGVLIALLSHGAGTAEAVVASFAYRVVTVLGDAVFFGFSLLFGGRSGLGNLGAKVRLPERER